MELIETFKELTTKYDNSMFEIFKSIIDEGKKEAEERSFDPIETFILVNEKLQNTFAQLALVQGIVSETKNYNDSLSSYIVSEKLQERIYSYLGPIIKEVRKTIKQKGEEVLESTSLDELQDRYNSLLSVLSMKPIQENEYLYQGIEFTKKK